MTACSLLTQSLAGQILQLNDSIERFDAKIEELFSDLYAGVAAIERRRRISSDTEPPSSKPPSRGS